MVCCRIARLDTIKKEITKIATLYCSFWDGISHVMPESKRSLSWSRSRYLQDGVVVGVRVAEISSTPQPCAVRMGVADVGWVGGYAHPAFLPNVYITLVGVA